MNWHDVQKGVQAVIIIGWDHYLANSEKTKANSIFDMFLNGVKFILNKFKKPVAPMAQMPKKEGE